MPKGSLLGGPPGGKEEGKHKRKGDKAAKGPSTALSDCLLQEKKEKKEEKEVREPAGRLVLVAQRGF